MRGVLGCLLVSRDGVNVGIAASGSIRGFSECNEMVGKGGYAGVYIFIHIYMGSESQAGGEVPCRGELTFKTMLVTHTLVILSE